MDIEITIRVPLPAGTGPVVTTAAAPTDEQVVGPPDVALPPAPTPNGSATASADARAGTATEHAPPSLEDFGLAQSPAWAAGGDAEPPSAEMIAQAEAEAARLDNGASAPPDVTQAPSWLDAEASPPAVDDQEDG